MREPSPPSDAAVLREGLRRPYVIGETTCVCGAPGAILYHSFGGWWCRAHESIPQAEYLKQQVGLDEGVRRFIEYHS